MKVAMFRIGMFTGKYTNMAEIVFTIVCITIMCTGLLPHP